KILGQAKSFGDAASTFLIGVIEMAQSELCSVAEKPKELAGMIATGDHHDSLDASAGELLERVVHHWPVVDGEQMLVCDARERVQALAGPAGEDDPPHAGITRARGIG